MHNLLLDARELSVSKDLLIDEVKSWIKDLQTDVFSSKIDARDYPFDEKNTVSSYINAPESSSQSFYSTPLTQEVKENSGYPKEITDNINSVEELDIYQTANIEPANVNDKPVLTRTDIDVAKTDDFGRSNLERMEQGLAPLDKDGRPIELHHIGQKADSPLAELTQPEHRGKSNDIILHDKQKESEINRDQFAKERSEHWKTRAEQLKQEGSV
ncbi:MAG: HNH/ENDO VII family nuclease [Moraxella sp.]|nr:HNH/ENDO VII family nuclease [Moraxella sp.]